MSTQVPFSWTDVALRYATLLSTVPAITSESSEAQLPEFWQWCQRGIVGLVQLPHLHAQLPALVQDTWACMESIKSSSGCSTGTFDPFGEPYRLVYQFTMRAMGIADIAESPELLNRSLGLFEVIAQSTSPFRVVFPILPTSAYLRRVWAGLQLYRLIDTIVSQRVKGKQRRNDALQIAIDNERGMTEIIAVSGYRSRIYLAVAHHANNR